MHLQLQMVGHFKNKNVAIKGHQFVNGLTTIEAGADYAAGITKYLSGWGAYPIHEAEKRQALLDASEGKQISMTVADGRVERLKVKLALAEQEREELVVIREEARTKKAMEVADRLEMEAQTQILVKAKMLERRVQAEELLATQEVEDDAVSDIASALEAGSGKEKDSKSFRSGKNANK